jgi:hypothetical protein
MCSVVSWNLDASKTPNPEWKAVRSVHLQGGNRAVNGLGPTVQFEPLATNEKIASFETPTYHGLFPLLSSMGFVVVGCDYFSDPAQLDGRRVPDWRDYHVINRSILSCAAQADQWSFLAHSAIKQKNGELWDISRRVSNQLRTCDWRLRQVSETYNQQLIARLLSRKFKDGLRFDDQFTWLGYLAIQSFLVDACTLRDYLAEYRALLLSQSGELVSKSKITKMASLKSRYLDKSPLSVQIDKILRDATNERGWLQELGSYRDLVVHVAPLASADKDLYTVCKSIRLVTDATLPAIKLPIPSDPGKISDSRHSGKHFDDPELNFARFLNAMDNPDGARDGLEYAHESLGKLALLAWHLSAISPVKPEMPTLTEADIFDFKITGGDQGV